MLNYYQLLNVDKKCSSIELKKAYRIAALFWHPDKNKSPQAHETFINITEAYNILIDPYKRKVYDAIFEEENNVTIHKSSERFNEKKYQQRQEYTEWRHAERAKAERQANSTSDKILTESFHFIDKYGWTIFLIAFILFTIIAFAVRG